MYSLIQSLLNRDLYHICVHMRVQIYKPQQQTKKRNRDCNVIQSHPVTQVDVVSACVTLEGGNGDDDLQS